MDGRGSAIWGADRARRGGEPGPRGRAEEPRADDRRPAACSGLAEGACRPPAEAKRVQETGGAVEGALGVAGGRGSRLSPGSWSHLCCAVRRMILAVLPLNSEAENAFLASVRPNRICEGVLTNTASSWARAQLPPRSCVTKKDKNREDASLRLRTLTWPSQISTGRRSSSPHPASPFALTSSETRGPRSACDVDSPDTVL